MRRPYLLFVVILVLFNVINVNLQQTLAPAGKIGGPERLSVQHILASVLLIMVIAAYWFLSKRNIVINRKLFVTHVVLTFVSTALIKIPFAFIFLPQENPISMNRLLVTTSGVLRYAYVVFVILQMLSGLYMVIIFMRIRHSFHAKVPS